MMTTIQMAREAGAWSQQSKNCDVEYVMTEASLEAFAALVRADEREACAKVCANMGHPTKLNYVGFGGAASACAAAIQARGETK